MAFDEGLAQRMREYFDGNVPVTEKKMFGGLCFLYQGNMCCGIVGDTLMARVGPAQYEACLDKPHAREMDFTGRAMKGMVYIAPEGISGDKDLTEWLETCLSFVTSLSAK